MKTNKILFVLLFTMLFQNAYGNWQYRRIIAISPADTVLTDYQLLLTLTPGNFDYTHSVGDSGHDLRFSTDGTGSTEPNVNYWIEDWNENDTSKVWIKVPNISSVDTTVIYLYYGNSSATSTSNGDSTFIFFDDFEDGVIDSPWVEVEYIGSIVENNGYLETAECGQYGGQYCMDGYAYIYFNLLQTITNFDLTNPFRIKIDSWNIEDSYPQGGEVVFTALWNQVPNQSYPITNAVLFKHADGSNHIGHYQGFNEGTFLGNYALMEDKWFSEEFRFDGGQLELWFDRVSKDTIPNWDYSEAFLVLGNTAGNSQNIDNNKWDNLLITKYTFAEPLISINTTEETGNWPLSSIDTSLVAYYPFNGNANDESGNGNDGTVNGATLTADRFGNANSAYSFTGDNDYITAGNTSNAPTGDFTLLSWIKTDDIEGLIIRKRPLSGTGFSLTIGTGAVGSNGKANIELQDDAGHVQIIETINNVNDNQWHLVASTRQDTIIKLYLDGSEVTTSLYYSTGAISGSLLNDADLNFGQTQNGTNDFDGLIDDIRIYNRALTAYEIDSLYHLNSWGTGLVAYYPFNGNANDESGNGNDGTVNGASLTNDRFGNANSAYSFDGVDDYITIADSPELNTSTITISSWMKLDDIANNGRIISKDNGSSLRSWFLASYGDYGWFHWGVFSGSNHIAVHSQTSRVPNQWHHLVSIYDGNNSKIYLNGALEDEIELLSGINNTGGEEIYIGRYALNSNYIQGVLDDIKIYNRALSATEIDSLYHLNGWAQENISLSIPELSVSMSDTILIPLNVQFMDSTSYSSAEITLSGYQSGLDFLAVVTDSSLTGDAGWTYAVNETDSLLITWAAGSQDISGSGVFCWLQFLVTGNGCTFVPINIESAIFNTGTDSVGITNGGVNIEPTPTYGDVDGNSYIQAYDASLILKHLVGLDTLDCQGLANAEVSANDTLTALDASLILQYGVGLIDTLPYDSVLLAMGTVNMEDGMLVPGAPLDVEIRLTDGANIYSFEGLLTYNLDHLTYQDATWSDLLNGFTIEVNGDNGSLTFAGAGANPDGQEGVLVTLHFSVNPNFDAAETAVVLERLRLNEGPMQTDVATATLTLSTNEQKNLPTTFALYPNYPNPFNPVTTIEYDIPISSAVELTVYNLLGEKVITLVKGVVQPGRYAVQWRGENRYGEAVGSGVYFYRLQTPQFSRTEKMIFLR